MRHFWTWCARFIASWSSSRTSRLEAVTPAALPVPASPATSAPFLPGTPASQPPWTLSGPMPLPPPSAPPPDDDTDLHVPDGSGAGTTYCQTGKRIILYERTGKSLKIKPLPLDEVIWYNERGLHVETEFEFRMGTMLRFGTRIEKTWPHKNKAWVAYALPGVKKTRQGHEDAHVTVYDGPIGPHSFY